MRTVAGLLAAAACFSVLAGSALTAPPIPTPGGGGVIAPPATDDLPTADVATWAAPGAHPAAVGEAIADPVARGRYLVLAGDCKACHTRAGGAPFAGGRPINTPFGAIYTANITPDRETGIGAWSGDEFYRALHHGVGRGGKRLYPAFPFPYFTHMTRADADDIRAYLMTVAPVSYVKPPNRLPFPLNLRFVMAIWDALFFHARTFQPDPARSAEWNRGAYLVQGPGHCGACHTPKNFLGADKEKQRLQGGKLDNWVALNLTGDPRRGLSAWSREDLVEYLRTGRNAQAAASGQMGEVIYFSTSRMSDADLGAIATFLKDLPAPAQPDRGSQPEAVTLRAGEAIYVDTCAACHRAGGDGVPRFFPPLKGDAALQATDPTTIVRIILQGTRSVPTPGTPAPLTMPSFAWKLTDAQIASVATYVRNSWGNAAPPVSPGQVAKLRKRLQLVAQHPS
ncbi:MAG TPA: c-type cytochrome [Caulobacteraceae bacterium]|nr:c-type cytochrome [Caulobacteraceae bacterium]